jgi:hypothetical protein
VEAMCEEGLRAHDKHRQVKCLLLVVLNDIRTVATVRLATWVATITVECVGCIQLPSRQNLQTELSRH